MLYCDTALQCSTIRASSWHCAARQALLARPGTRCDQPTGACQGRMLEWVCTLSAQAAHMWAAWVAMVGWVAMEAATAGWAVGSKGMRWRVPRRRRQTYGNEEGSCKVVLPLPGLCIIGWKQQHCSWPTTEHYWSCTAQVSIETSRLKVRATCHSSSRQQLAASLEAVSGSHSNGTSRLGLHAWALT